MRALTKQQGFSLIELVIFIVIVGIATSAIALIFAKNVQHSADPILRQKAIAVSKAYIDEIVRKKWDELSPDGGGCIDTSANVCENLWQTNTRYEIGERIRPTAFNTHIYEVVASTGSGRSDNTTEPTWPTDGSTVVDRDLTWQDLGAPTIGANGTEMRWQFDDVDDYHGINDSPPQYPDSSDAVDGKSPMPGYTDYSVTVNVSNSAWDTLNAVDVKKIDVTVSTPNSESLTFTLYRVNY